MNARANVLSDLIAALGEWSAGAGPLYRDLAEGLRGAIRRGELAPGYRLPSERGLARRLALSRSTVVAAYDELRGEGWLEARRGSGTYVPRRERSGSLARQGAPIVVQSASMSGLGSVAKSPASEAETAATIELTVGAPTGFDAIPAEAWSAAADDIRELTRSHGYMPLGLPSLREAIAARMTAGGLPTRRDQVLITSGAQQAIVMAVSVFVRPGDWVLLENPTWSGSMDALRSAGANLIPIPLDGEGARVDAISDLLRRFTPRLAYLCPTHQNPTGTVMGGARRRELARLVEDSGLPLIDDCALAELSLAGDPPPPVAAFARSGSEASILTLGSMSKVFWGGLRVGWIRAPEAVVERLARIKAVTDQGSSLVSQAVAVRLLERMDEVRAMRRAQGIERLTLVQSLIAELLPGWTCNRPQGGHIAWVRLPRGDAGEFSQVALRYGVSVVAGSLASPDGGMREYLRIPFVYEPAVLAEGFRRLAAAWAAYSASLDGRGSDRVLV